MAESGQTIRLLLVDDQQLMREGLRTLLELEPDLRVVGEAADGRAAVEVFETEGPDVVLMDVRMPVMDGVSATRRILAREPEAKVIILTTFDDDAQVFDGLRAGALGYLLKDLSGSDLARAVRTVAAGGALIEPSVARKVLGELTRRPAGPRTESEGRGSGEARRASGEQRWIEPLVAREREVLEQLTRGRSNREIAAALSLAEGTVKNYVTAILQKLGARDRTQAALIARDTGLIDSGSSASSGPRSDRSGNRSAEDRRTPD